MASPPRLAQPGSAPLTRDDITHRLPEITAPALVVHGTADVPIPLEEAEALSAGLLGSSGVIRIPGGTHSGNLTHPEAVNDAILSFLATLPD